MLNSSLFKLSLLVSGIAIACGAPAVGAEGAGPVRLAAASTVSTASSLAVAVDKGIPEYKKTSAEVSGSIKIVGSDTMAEVSTGWTEGFRKFYPDVQAEVEAKGSATAPPALIQMTSNFGPMSRDWAKGEIDLFESKFGYKPTVLPAAIDMLAVYVNKDNPIQGLTFQQVDAVFSKNRKGGASKEITTWGDLGLTGEWADKPINLYGRNSASGTYAYFKEHALFKGDYKDTVKEEPGSSAVVQAVTSDKFGMGYSGIGYKTAGVLAVPLALKAGQSFIPAEPANAYSGKYPLARFLYVSVNYKPGSNLDPLRAEFIKYFLSRSGQEEVITNGYLPILPKIATADLKKVGL
ncbi:MAG TPA: PstS family phosphate ABC transporter substrate-binding protein [Pirellulales bacterium]|jgi:phosphate transport system substrate-binding protein|nr:PstS family phosphate ABC transporter substrate-binding protein [Pirellulales bacterium]